MTKTKPLEEEQEAFHRPVDVAAATYSSPYSKYCGNPQADLHFHLSLSYFSVGSPY
jgi:hypothetical protein